MFRNYSKIFLVLLFTMMSSFSLAATSQQENLKQGKLLYLAHCLHCHGENADGKGAFIELLKVEPANLNLLNNSSDGCVTDKVLKAVLGRHKLLKDSAKMPLLKDVLTLEKVYYISEYIKTKQKADLNDLAKKQ